MKTTRCQQWLNARPCRATASNGDVWTREVEMEGNTLWFHYQDSQGNVYASREEPSERIELTGLNYRCVPTSEAKHGLN